MGRPVNASPASPDDFAAVQRAMFDYAAAIDNRDYPLLRSVLADRMTVTFRSGGDVDYPGFGPAEMTADDFVDRNRTLFLGFAGTHHQVTNVRVDIEGDTARLRAHLQAIHFFPGEPGVEYTFGAFYANELIRSASGWRIAVVDITVTWQRGDPGMTERARQAGIAVQSRK